MNRTNNIYDVCIYIILYENNNGRQVSNLRLQKLLYFVQASFYLNTNGPCFEDEFEAWEYGPVIPKVYARYKFYGSLGIGVSEETNLEDLRTSLLRPDIIDSVLKRTSIKSTPKLVDISHSQDPWKTSYRRGYKHKMSNSTMKKYFVAKA